MSQTSILHIRRSIPVMLCLTLVSLILACSACSTPPAASAGAADAEPLPLVVEAIPANAVCRDVKASAEARAKNLLTFMTLEEKIGQMTQPARDYLLRDENIGTFAVGSVLSGGGSGPTPNNPEAWADMYDYYQSMALTSRLAIPIIYGIDAVHGNNNVKGSTIFPHNIGLGATRDAALVEQAARITAIEVAATGIDWTFAPCITVPQDIRWGRTYEGYSENPALVAELGTAAVKGFQAGSAPDDRLPFMAPDAILACIKHFVGDGGTTGGVDRGNTEVDEATLRSQFLAPYLPAIRAGAGSVMVSFSQWNGTFMHQSKYLINDVLKAELGFKGFVVSDWAGVKEAPGNAATQIQTSINAGIDMVMVPDNYGDFIATLVKLVQDGKVSQERIDDAVLRILTIKFRIGLFERPFADRSLLATVGSAEHRALARQAVRESQVILKNDKLLPLSKQSTIIVTGSAARDIGVQCGGWTISWQGSTGNITPGTTVLEAVQQLVGDKGKVIFIENPADIATTAADAAIVATGELPYAEMKGDSNTLAFRASDLELIQSLRGRKIPVVTLLFSGRPIIINEALAASNAFVASFLPGTEGGGIADVLFGDFKPSGKLSYTWPDSLAAIPVHAEKAGVGVLYPYGYGLSW